METNFRVAKYEKLDTGFNLIGYDEYLVTYLKGKKPHLIRIVVNNILTNRNINLIDGKSGYKNQILSAISDYKNDKISMNNVVSEKKKVTLGYIRTFYSNLIVRNVKNYLMGINKEESRDRLTKYELI
jgi:hypothetical protein